MSSFGKCRKNCDCDICEHYFGTKIVTIQDKYGFVKGQIEIHTCNDGLRSAKTQKDLKKGINLDMCYGD